MKAGVQSILRSGRISANAHYGRLPSRICDAVKLKAEHGWRWKRRLLSTTPAA